MRTCLDDSSILAAIALFLLAVPAGALAATKPVRVNLAGVLFNGKENPKVTENLGVWLRFIWKDGFHNVLTSKAPAKANKVNSGDPTDEHKPIDVQAHEEGQVRLVLRAHQDARHGFDADRECDLTAAYQLRPPSVETSSSPSAATAYQMRSLRGSEATIVARGPLVCQVAP